MSYTSLTESDSWAAVGMATVASLFWYLDCRQIWVFGMPVLLLTVFAVASALGKEE